MTVIIWGEGLYVIETFLSSTRFLIKWYFMSVCFVLFPLASFFAFFIAAWLLTLRGIWKTLTVPVAKLISRPSHSPSSAKELSATFSTSAAEVVTTACFFDFHDTTAPEIVIAYPIVYLQSCLQPAQSESRNPSNFKGPHGPVYAGPVSVVSLMYRNHRLTHVHRPIVGKYTYCESRPTENVISGLVQIMRYI